MSNQLAPSQNRIVVIDSLRGFALAGIVLVHMVEQYVAGPPTTAFQEMMPNSIADQVVQTIIGLFFTGKFFALFSILFGLSYYIQMNRAAEKGIDYKWRFLWRIVLLFIIGFAHNLFYRGDILVIYALASLFLIPLFEVKNRNLLILAGLMLLGAGRYLVFIIYGSESIFGLEGFELDSTQNLAYFEAITNGGILDVFYLNATYGMLTKFDFQLGLTSRFFLTIGYFIIGLWLGKIGIFENFVENKKQVRKIMLRFLIGIPVAIVFTGLMFFISGGNPMADGFNWWSVSGMTGMDIFNICLTAIILCGFLLLYTKASWQNRFDKLAPYGRTALTNYFLQSVIGTFIFFGWGLGYLGHLGNTVNFFLALLIIIIQAVLSSWWLKQFKYGPLEWLWRCGTYLKWQPFKR